MNEVLAAAAAEVDDALTVDEWEQLVAGDDVDLVTELHARDAMLAIARLEAEQERVRELLTSITERYTAKIETLEREKTRWRETLNTYVTRYGKVSVPDVGTAYHTTRNKGGKLKLADAAAFADWAETAENVLPLLAFTEPTLDVRATFDKVVVEFKMLATRDGKVITEEGAILEVPGVEALPESKTLALRAV